MTTDEIAMAIAQNMESLSNRIKLKVIYSIIFGKILQIT